MGNFNIQDSAGLFFEESKEMLVEMEEYLLDLEKDFDNDESINALFRSVHTIKGSSGMFGFTKIEKFTHIVESSLDLVRNGELKLNSELIGVYLDSHDLMESLLDLAEADPGAELDEEKNKKQIILTEKLNKSLKNNSDESVSSNDEPLSLNANDESNDNGDNVKSDLWHISLRLHEDVFKNTLDPRSFIKFLDEYGEVKKILVVSENIPEFSELDPELAYLGFEISYKSSESKEKIESIFDFLLDDCNLRIIPPKSNIHEYVKLLEELPEEPMQIGDMLVKAGTITKTEIEKILLFQEGIDDYLEQDKKFVGELLVEEKLVEKPVLEAALKKQKEVKKIEERKNRSIRVDANKIDVMINLVGELVITGSNITQKSELSKDKDLKESVLTMARLIEDIRDSTMNLRMVQIGETFKKFERVIRDISKQSDKEIKLEISGSETELDKSLIEKISDPLMHMIRNSADHGIETSKERKALGKNSFGTIKLNAYQETGSIVIEVSDDGGGINKESIFKKAVERGILKEGQQISDEDLYQVLFAPGFSTAEKITNVSGRGVGMDVVKKNIESLRGIIQIESEEGKGTTMRITLPLTLAIIDGFMVKVADQHFVLPLDMVVECTKVQSEDINLRDGGNFLNLRGELLPYMFMRDFFGLEKSDKKTENIVIIEYAKIKAGFVVDSLHGEFQTVVKPMGEIFKNLTWITGSTILGTGEVAYILDVPMLIKELRALELNK